MEPPSAELIQALQTLKIANDRELQKCRTRVRRLSQGLPAFDSVWIDALVHVGVMTQFQARYFEQKRWHELQLTESLVLRDQVHFDPVMPVFLAVDVESNTRCMVTRCGVDRADFEAVSVRLRTLRQVRSDVPSTGTFLLDPDKRFVAQSRPAIEGESLERLLIRRGRFPEAVVRSIAVGVCDYFEQNGETHLHGDLRLSNLWLTASGRLELLNAGLFNLVSPSPTIHTKIPIDAYNGIAPERLEAGKGVSVSTEMYAFGCLLWQLLAGRPPHALADPLAKLAAHRQKAIRDIRELAPDVSDEFAEFIAKLTQRQPLKRPKRWADASSMISGTTKTPQARLKSFLHSFESAAPRSLGQSREKSPVPYAKISLTLGLTIIASILFWNRDQFNLPALSQVGATTQPIAPEDFKPLVPLQTPTLEKSEEIKTAEISLTQKALPALPVPDQEGVVLLDHPGPFRTTSLHVDDVLIIRGQAGIRPTIRVEDNSAILEAKTVSIENVQLEFIRSDQQQGASHSVLQVVADEFRFSQSLIAGSEEASNQSLLSWRANGADTMASGRLLVSNIIVKSRRPLIESTTPLTTALFDNVLQRLNGPLLFLHGGVHAGLRVPVVLNHCSMVEPGPVVTVDRLGETASSGLLSLQGKESLLKTSGNVPLIGFHGGKLSETWSDHVEVAAQGLIVPQAGKLFGHRTGPQESWSELASQFVRVDGLLSGEFHFTEPVTESEELLPVPQAVINHLPVRLSSENPGFNFERFEASLN
ncbi:serine/threonine protein kinase [Thalassoglobus polymorphus]|uniref:Serine/threonine-protein kinase PknD n=1 Tax=Thalassoglobus polymorphus TaxID=2527994 RepID=A0A517QKQ4_9PLAN|nr:protein kinase [Thalassoglobus polymorphus]QDT32117.1 Serine/threonine-protein kinase PknD [Thalassoglobus polymorphus]